MTARLLKGQVLPISAVKELTLFDYKNGLYLSSLEAK